MGLVQHGQGEGLDNSSRDPGCIPNVSRRTVRPSPQPHTEPRHGVTPHRLSQRNAGAGGNGRLVGKGMVSAAKAHGKATGEADGDTATWKVEVGGEAHTPETRSPLDRWMEGTPCPGSASSGRCSRVNSASSEPRVGGMSGQYARSHAGGCNLGRHGYEPYGK